MILPPQAHRRTCALTVYSSPSLDLLGAAKDFLPIRKGGITYSEAISLSGTVASKSPQHLLMDVRSLGLPLSRGAYFNFARCFIREDMSPRAGAPAPHAAHRLRRVREGEAR